MFPMLKQRFSSNPPWSIIDQRDFIRLLRSEEGVLRHEDHVNASILLRATILFDFACSTLNRPDVTGVWGGVLCDFYRLSESQFVILTSKEIGVLSLRCPLLVWHLDRRYFGSAWISIDLPISWRELTSKLMLNVLFAETDVGSSDTILEASSWLSLVKGVFSYGCIAPAIAPQMVPISLCAQSVPDTRMQMFPYIIRCIKFFSVQVK